MAAAWTRAIQPAEVIIREGDEADNFYLIVEGVVEVTQARPDGRGTRVLREMGRGQFFGEIGLLSGIARTATVTAVREGKLVVLGRDAFLDLVSAGSGLTYRLLDLHRGAISGGGEARQAPRAADV